MKEYLYTYWWKPVNGKPIEMTGQFTEERWKMFCKNPHPVQRGIEIQLISKISVSQP